MTRVRLGSTPAIHPIFALEVHWRERFVVSEEWAGSIPVQGANLEEMKMAAKRSLVLEGTDQPPLAIAKVTQVNIPKRCLYLEERSDGTFLLMYTTSLLPDITKLQALRVVRDDEPV